MEKILQISLVISSDSECDGTDLANSVAEVLNRRGYDVISSEFIRDVTEYYHALNPPIHKYLMEIRQFFSGYEQFTVEARSKAEALEKAKEYINTNPHFAGGNHERKSLRCVKKLQKGKDR